MNTTERAACMAALEALEYHTQQTRPIQRTEAAILGLREALAQPTQPQPDTVPWPVVSRYSGGASVEGVAGRVWIQLGDGPEEVEYRPTQPQGEPRDAWHGGHSFDASMLRDLLARIHGDGGHYVEAHGIEKATEDAHGLVADWRAAAPQRVAQPETISLQEAWEAAGGNPGIKATRQELIDALQSMDAAIEEADEVLKSAQRVAQPLTPLTEAQQRDLVKECGFDWHKGYMPLFDGDPTNRFSVLIEAVEAAHGIGAAAQIGGGE
jgi:hypothetical protein